MGGDKPSDPWRVAVLSLSAGNMHNLSGTCTFVNEGIPYLKFQVLVAYYEGITFSFIFWYIVLQRKLSELNCIVYMHDVHVHCVHVHVYVQCILYITCKYIVHALI